MNERAFDITNPSTRQPAFLPTPSCFESRLHCLLDQLRALEREFFSLDPCSPIGLAAGQIKLLLLRYQTRIPVQDGQLREARLILQNSLEFGP